MMVCLLLNVCGIEQKINNLEAFLMGGPFALNFLIFHYCTSDKSEVNITLKFRVYNVLLVFAVFVSILAYAFEKSWYIFGVLITVILVLRQLYCLKDIK